MILKFTVYYSFICFTVLPRVYSNKYTLVLPVYCKNLKNDSFEQLPLIDISKWRGSRFYYRVFIEYCVFSLKFCDFSELCQFCCSLVCFLPAWCVYKHWHRGKTEKGQSPEYFLKIGKKNTIFNEHPVEEINFNNWVFKFSGMPCTSLLW